jgi:hypothetical protein
VHILYNIFCIGRFNPSSVVYYLTIAIKSKFDWFYPTWGYATKAMRDFWFDEFKVNMILVIIVFIIFLKNLNTFSCSYKIIFFAFVEILQMATKYEACIRQFFYIKEDVRVRGIMYQERLNYAKNTLITSQNTFLQQYGINWYIIGHQIRNLRIGQ